MFKKKSIMAKLDEAIEQALDELNKATPGTQGYTDCQSKVEVLMKAKADLQKSGREKLSINTVLTVLGSLAGVILMLNYEELHCMTSKAMSFIIKPKL